MLLFALSIDKYKTALASVSPHNTIVGHSGLFPLANLGSLFLPLAQYRSSSEPLSSKLSWLMFCSFFFSSYVGFKLAMRHILWQAGFCLFVVVFILICPSLPQSFMVNSVCEATIPFRGLDKDVPFFVSSL